MKIKDRMLLGIVAGLIGNIPKTIVDELTLKRKSSQVSFRETAAGLLVNKRSEASKLQGRILGELFDMGMSSLGGIGLVYLLSKTGRDHIITKGIFSGIALGTLITVILNNLPSNKVEPKTASSNLSYMLSQGIFGLTVVGCISKLGHSSLFDTKPFNNYLKPTEKTSEQEKG
ncbi:hypothetical protein [Natranaerobius trueperi]|uniref:DUF4126 domain-containing protein n=1 Tax=Natranaerobius trueperi TaxID=759412 RepID=A0A226C392_9FIRM|nr:hypothetical protein [Natranaerobius trueperi]OWZ84887.1 hypothetical protein CDO51_00325 [Natranaerobius trueperi]